MSSAIFKSTSAESHLAQIRSASRLELKGGFGRGCCVRCGWFVSQTLLQAANWLNSRYSSHCVLYFKELMSWRSFRNSSKPLHTLFNPETRETNIMFGLSVPLSERFLSSYWSHPSPESERDSHVERRTARPSKHDSALANAQGLGPNTQNMKNVAIKGLISILEKLQVAAVSFD